MNYPELGSDTLNTSFPMKVPKLEIKAPRVIHQTPILSSTSRAKFLSQSPTYSGCGSITTHENMVNQKMFQIRNLIRNEAFSSEMSPD